MKLGKLLGAGKSFFGWQGSVSYRENKQVYLPIFNPGRNPFAPKPAAPKPEAPAPKGLVPAAASTQPLPAIPVPGPVRAANWTEKLNPFRVVKPARHAPVVSMPNVQPEFSLNAVKVVHNDLSDADVEVVPMKSRSATPAAGKTGAPAPMEFLGEPVLKSI
jgi:hypothetical protein